MKEKLLELLDLELNNLDTLKFRGTHYNDLPASEISYCNKEIYSTETSHKEFDSYKSIKFNLQITNNISISVNTKDTDYQSVKKIKKPWFSPAIYEYSNTKTAVTSIRCGQIKFELTEEERDKLFNDVIESYAALTKYKLQKDESKIIDTIQSRIDSLKS